MTRLFTLAACLTLMAQEQAVDMQAMMAKAKKFTAPGENHKLLEKFLGTWTMEMRGYMKGVAGKASTGEQTCTWYVKGRFVQCRGGGPLFGMQLEFATIIGYDNFKQSYRVMHLSSMDTSLNTSEGDLTPDGKTLLTYGTIDEYLTGEHDKMVKYVWRFDSADQMRFEVHDLPIGEQHTQVMGFTFRRR
ncbi:MAG: DUF1579 domain-containing protein [Acidobacteria bacterium]|nr:DUF1579 domain-containing protein [Acidobacteriota bacterium]